MGEGLEEQKSFVGCHWQDNMVQQFHVCRRHVHFFVVCLSSTESG